jgi:hypothetical protein
MKAEMKQWLLSLVEDIEDDDWDDSELIDWAMDFLSEYHDQDDRPEPGGEPVLDELDLLKAQVVPYKTPFFERPLPFKPDGSLYGIAFIYDHDMDDRILVAIDMLKEFKSIKAMGERKGTLTIYTETPLVLEDLQVHGDCWGVQQMVPYKGQWVSYDKEFVNFCVAKVLKSNQEPTPTWQTEPPTPKQVAYLKALGYTGEIPATKTEIGSLINEHKEKAKTVFVL